MNLADSSQSIVLVVDLQPGFLKAIPDAQATVRRAEFLLKVAALLDVPVLTSEQYATRMGGSDPTLLELIARGPNLDKMSFGAWGDPGWRSKLIETERKQAILVGAETHICVMQTALELRTNGYEVFLATDAICGRPVGAHDGAIRRMVQAGAIETHTESVTYEWLRTAQHQAFKQVLQVVKEFAG